jgi:hypothetical protein
MQFMTIAIAIAGPSHRIASHRIALHRGFSLRVLRFAASLKKYLFTQ